MKNEFKKIIDKLADKNTRTFSHNEVIVGAGRKQKDCFYIKSGFVKVYDLNADGNIKTIAILKSGDMFPLIWGFDHTAETIYYYKAIGSVSLLSVETARLKQLLDTNMNAAREAHLAFVYLTWDFMERIKCLQMPYTQEKIIRLLPYLIAKMGSKKSGTIYELEYSITQEEIGQLLGATRESVSAHLSKLEKKNIINRDSAHMKIDISKIPDEYIHDIWFK